MAGYKVSYKVLRQQGEEMKAVAKLVDGYAERITQISGKLSNDEMMSEVRGNLQKLRAQLGESRLVLSKSGELLIKSVENYTGAETRQVKKIDGMKAHNRDFYKNPVVVASAGGAASGAAIAGGVVPPTPAATTINYTDNSTHVTYTAEPMAANTPPAADPSASVLAAASGAGVAAAAGGAAAGAGAMLGGMQLKKKRDAAKSEKNAEPPGNDEYNPEAELEKAIQRVRELENDDEPAKKD